MHHAYPRECPFPHLAGTTAPVTQDEWTGETDPATLMRVGDLVRVRLKAVGDEGDAVLELEQKPAVEVAINESAMLSATMMESDSEPMPTSIASAVQALVA